MPEPDFKSEMNNPKDNSKLGQKPVEVEGPPEEEFWERYNRRLEFPLSTVGTVFMHILVGTTLLFGYYGCLMKNEEDRSGTPMQLVEGGFDDEGEGSAGSGGAPDPFVIADTSPFKSTKDILPTPEALQDAKENIRRIYLDDKNSNLAISAHNAAALEQLNDDLKKKILGVGSQKGEGNNPGKGFDNTAGAGPGGSGADSTRARSLRWVLRFRVVGGRDYVDQLKTMGAEILVPIPPGDKDCQ
ncbi:MAG: hypothetical protein L0241_18175, partial [Planctomycetia bacterium]|nr:hypothetical protein [Planctomycetia bacterium]